MRDDVAAGSSPATEAPPPPDLGAWTDQEYDTWRTTGDSPAPPKQEPKTEEPAPSEPPAEKPAKAASGTEPGSDPEPKEPEKEKGKALKARSAELQTEIDQLQSRLRQRRELRQELESLAAQQQAKPEPAKAAAATDGEPMLDSFLDEAEQKGETFAQAIQAHARAHSKWAIERHESEKVVAEQQRKATEKSAVFEQRVDAFAAEHPDYDEVLAAGKSVRFGDRAYAVLQEFVLESDKPGDLLYHLGKNVPRLQTLASLSPIALIRELAKIELGLGSNGADPLAAPKKTPAPPPPPPAALNGRNTPAADDAEEAIANGDFTAYQDRMNKRDIASRAAQRT
jgi:hypothetical protein